MELRLGAKRAKARLRARLRWKTRAKALEAEELRAKS
jgi:hypothetical protein